MERHELRVGKLEAQTIMQGGEPYIRFIAEVGNRRTPASGDIGMTPTHRERTTSCGTSSSPSRGRPSDAEATMPRIDARLEKLEAQTRSESEVVVFAMPSESVEDCIRRHGHDPEDVSLRHTVVRWACESDARL